MEKEDQKFLEFDVYEPMEILEFVELDNIIEDTVKLFNKVKKITAEIREEYKRKQQTEEGAKRADFKRHTQYVLLTEGIRHEEYLLFNRLENIIHIVGEIPLELLELKAYLNGFIAPEDIIKLASDSEKNLQKSIYSQKTISDRSKRERTAKYFGEVLANGGKIDDLIPYRVAKKLNIHHKTARAYMNDSIILKKAEIYYNGIIARESRAKNREKTYIAHKKVIKEKRSPRGNSELFRYLMNLNLNPEQE